MEKPERTANEPPVARVSLTPGNTQPQAATQSLGTSVQYKTLNTVSSPRPLPCRTAPVLGSHRPLDKAARQALRLVIIRSPAYEEDYVNLADLSLMLPRMAPDVNPRNYGYERLREFTAASGIVDVRIKQMGPHPSVALVRRSKSNALQCKGSSKVLPDYKGPTYGSLTFAQVRSTGPAMYNQRPDHVGSASNSLEPKRPRQYRRTMKLRLQARIGVGGSLSYGSSL